MDSDGSNLNFGCEPTSSSLDTQNIQQADFFSSSTSRQKGIGSNSNHKGFKFMRINKPDASALLARPFLFAQRQQLTPKKPFSPKLVSSFTRILNSPQTFSESIPVDTQIHTPSERNSRSSVRRGSSSTRSLSSSLCANSVHSIHNNTNSTISMKGQACDDARTTVEKLFMDIEHNNRRCTELQSEVASLTASNLSVKRSHLQCTQELEPLQSELLQVKAQLASSQHDLQSSQSIIEATRAELVSVNTQLTSKCGELSMVTAEIVSMRAHKLRAMETLKGAQDNYCTLQAAFKTMKTEHNLSQELLTTAMKEIKALRHSVADGLAVIRPLINEEGSYMRATQTRTVVQELQDAISDSQRVTDLLRDKLHHLSAQLADSQTKVRELEEEKRSVWCKALNDCQIQASKSQVLLILEDKVNDLAARLFKRETETFDALSDAACLRTALDTAQQKLSETSNLLNEKTTALKEALAAQEQGLDKLSACMATLSRQESDMSILKAKNIALEESKADLRALASEAKRTLSEREIELKDKDVGPALKAEIMAINEKLMVAENMRKETLASKSLQDEEMVRLRCDNTRLEGDKSNLEQMLEASSNTTKEYQNQLIALRKSQDEAVGKCDTLQRELKERRIDAQLDDEIIVKLRKQLDEVRAELIALTCKQSTIAEKHIFLESERSRLQKEFESKKEEHHQEQLRISVIQDRFDSQAATLRLAKEHNGDLQDRLALSQCSFASKLESTTGELRAEIAVMTEKNNALKLSLDRLKQDSATQSATFIGASVEFEQKLAKQESTSERHIEAQEQRASAAELALEAVKRESLRANDTICGLEKQLDDLRKACHAATEANAMCDESLELARLRTCLSALEEEKRVLLERESHLMDRYQEGKLTNNEKDFVTYLIQTTRSLHEEEMVAKDNELSLRQSTIKSLNSKISGVESTLARILKEKGKEADPGARSMVDLKLWMSSSPKQVPEDQILEKSRTHTPSVEILIPHEQPIVSVTSPTHRHSASGLGKKPMTFARLTQDSDDEYAPSEISQLSSASRKRASPPVVSEEPLRLKKRLRASTAHKTTHKPPLVQKKPVEHPVKTRQRRK